MPKFVILIALFVPFVTLAQNLAPKDVKTITANFNQTMMMCPGKIWSDYNWSGLQIALIYPTKLNSWIWDASADSLQEISNSSLPSTAIESIYNFFEMNDRTVMSLNMEKGYKEIFQLGIHEFFHHYGQKTWTSSQVNGQRGTVYPVTWQPRLYRRMIFENLKKYLEFSQPSDLGRARYWYDRWSNENPSEANSTTDGYEGTAEYVETLAEVLANNGCSATEEQLRSQVAEQVKANFGYSVSGQDFGLDNEGYELGGLSSLILRFKANDLSAWNSRISQGETPLQILLESVSPILENAPQELVKTFQESAQRINAERSPLLDKDIANWLDKSYVRVSTSYKWLQSNLRPKFFARSSQIQMNLYPLNSDHHYLSPDSRSNFKLKANAVVFSHYIPACPNQHHFTLVPASLIQLTNGVATISSPSFDGSIVGDMKADDQGNQYLCVE